MKYFSLFIIPPLIFSSCSNTIVKECKVIEYLKVQNYIIEKKQCGDFVLNHYFRYTISTDGKTSKTDASRTDSCIFTWQADNETRLTLNVCDNTIRALKANKVPLELKSIDSVTMFSRESGQTQLLTSKQIEKLAEDWNTSKARGYSEEPLDSAFSVHPPYQYRMIVFLKGSSRTFYGYNYVILDSSNWKFEMSNTQNLQYFHNYWKR